MKHTAILTAIIFNVAIQTYGQGQKNKNYFPVWTYHQNDANIHGISIGLYSLNNYIRNTNTNGVKVELVGAGFLVPLIPKSPIATSDSVFKGLKNIPLSEKINGLSLSASGTVCHCLTNGASFGLLGQMNFQNNGISASLYLNFSQLHNGLQFAFQNEAYDLNGMQVGISNYGVKAKGIQVGLFNKSGHLNGIQIGFWNENQKRKLPLINWSFGA